MGNTDNRGGADDVKPSCHKKFFLIIPLRFFSDRIDRAGDGFRQTGLIFIGGFLVFIIFYFILLPIMRFPV
jgi:hypothetical protein